MSQQDVEVTDAEEALETHEDAEDAGDQRTLLRS